MLPLPETTSSGGIRPPEIDSTGSPEIGFFGEVVIADSSSSAKPGLDAPVWIRFAAIAFAVLWIYSPVVDGEWLWDDDYLLTNNPVVQSPDGLWKLWFAPATADYFPLTMSALWLQWRFFGLDSTGYHWVAAVLHILGAVGVWALFSRIGLRGAWLAGLIFAVHPLAVESVAWISELKNTLSLPIFLAAAWCWVIFDETRRPLAFAGALGLFLLAMLGKSSVVMFPCVILLFAWWKRGCISRRDILASVPFFVVSLLLGLVTLHFQHSRAIGDEPIPIGGWDARLAIAGMALFFYLGKIIWPFPLVPIYPQWKANPPSFEQLLPWVGVLLLVAFCWRFRKTFGRHLAMGLGFYAIMIFPVLGFVAMSYMRVGWVADHFVYVPMIGILGLLVDTAVRGSDCLSARRREVAMACAAVGIGVLAVSSHCYAGVWQNEDRLWTHTLAHNPNSWQAHNRLGARIFNRGNAAGALPHFREAVRLRPDLAETRNNLGSAILAQKDTRGAIQEFRAAREMAPGITAIQANLANALFLDGAFREAIQEYADLVRQFPENPVFLCNHGVALYRAGRIPEAIQSFEKALRINPSLEDARRNLEVARQQLRSGEGS